MSAGQVVESVAVVATDSTASAIETAWRIDAPRIIAGLTRVVGDLGLAEELAQDALVIALERWPDDGIPANPGGWLMTTAKHRALDLIRRRATYERKLQELGHATPLHTDPDLDAALDDPVGDDLLRLIFMTCHPVLSAPARAALTLRLLGGLTTAEIARAFLTTEPTAAQRIVRAKRTLAQNAVRFDMPTQADLSERLQSVLEVIYLIFNEGYAATSGADWTRPDLCMEALRLGRVLAALMPEEPEAHGLTALMELQASRMPARTGPGGEPVLLLDQNRARWDRLLIRRGLAALESATATGRLGPYTVQAAIAACHARAATAGDTDWGRIASLYGILRQLTPSPVVELNRGIAVGMAEGPTAGLAILDTLDLDDYAQLPAARGEMLDRLGRHAEAADQFRRAAELTDNESERAIFLSRAAKT